MGPTLAQVVFLALCINSTFVHIPYDYVHDILFVIFASFTLAQQSPRVQCIAVQDMFTYVELATLPFVLCELI